MIDRWIELDRAITPQGDILVLRRRGVEFEIRFNGWELMSTRTSVSEEALARLAYAELNRKPHRTLVGGLGMGYTLRAALDATDAEARIAVCELVPAIVDWVRGPLADLTHRPLDDARVEMRVGDVSDALTDASAFDAILLDTDNGPDAVMYWPNRDLYTREGLDRMMRALAPNGVAAFWSADRSSSFEHTLDAAGLDWRRVAVDARGGDSGPEHSVYLARLR